MRGSATRNTLIAVMIAMAAFVGWVIAANFREMTYRTQTIWTMQELRSFAVGYYDLSPAERDQAFGEPYWGALTPVILKRLKLSPNEIIDPYNRDAPEAEWRTGPVFQGDRGASLRIRGGDFQIYDDGTGFWIIIGRGPDGKLDFHQRVVDSFSKDQKARLEKQSYESSLLAPYTYDPSNGTVSAGDIWRTSEN